MISRSRAAVVLAASVWSVGATAAQWSVDPSMVMRADRVYNPYLAQNDPISLYAGRLSVQAPLHIEEETRSLVITPRLSGRRYDREKSLNGDEASLGLAMLTESENVVWRLDGNMERASTVTSEWDDTGYVGARKWRITRALSPSVQWAAAPETTLSFSGNRSEIQYAAARDTPLVGYDYTSANAGVTREFGERASGGVSLYASRLEAPRIDNTSDDFGAQLNATREWNEIWYTRVQLGGHRTHSQVGATDEWQHGATSEASLTRNSEYGKLDFSWSRSVSPSGYGVLVRRDLWTYTQSRALTERIGTSLLLRLQRDESLTASRTDANRRAVRLEWRLSVVLAPEWNAVLGIDYARQRYDADEQDAETGALLIQVGYHIGPVPLATRANEHMTE